MRIVGSLLYIAFYQYISDNLPQISNSIAAIRSDRAYKIKEYAYQFDRYQGKLPPGAKLNDEICFATDILDQKTLEVYFSDKKRESELKSVAFQIVDKILGLIENHKSESTVLFDLNHLPMSEYPHHNWKEFNDYIKAKKRNKPAK